MKMFRITLEFAQEPGEDDTHKMLEGLFSGEINLNYLRNNKELFNFSAKCELFDENTPN